MLKSDERERRMPTDLEEFSEVAKGLIAGDFSRLEPYFNDVDQGPCAIVRWHTRGYFRDHPQALTEAFTCACFLGKLRVVDHLLAAGVDPSGGIGTGLNAAHWAGNRGQFEVMERLIAHRVSLETRNMYGGTVLDCTLWSAEHEPRSGQTRVIEILRAAGATT